MNFFALVSSVPLTLILEISAKCFQCGLFPTVSFQFNFVLKQGQGISEQYYR